MHHKHCEVSRLTFGKNMTRCLQIHANSATIDTLEDDPVGNEKANHKAIDWNGLVHCIEHNTDKIDRRFFGYYNNHKMNLVTKYATEMI